VIEPEVKIGRGLRTLTVSDPEDTGIDVVFADISIEWPANIVVAGEYDPEVEIKPVEPVPPTKPLTDHTTLLATPFTAALYCAWLPSLTSVGPVRETPAGDCARRQPVKVATRDTSQIIV
jgi:hypothetical protein